MAVVIWSVAKVNSISLLQRLRHLDLIGSMKGIIIFPMKGGFAFGRVAFLENRIEMRDFFCGRGSESVDFGGDGRLHKQNFKQK